MTKVEALVATMNHPDPRQLLQTMQVSGPAVVVNQVGSGRAISDAALSRSDGTTVATSGDRGLSRSRNLAMSLATSDICVLADDDQVFHPAYADRISHSFRALPDSDVIAFAVQHRSSVRKPPMEAESLSQAQLMKVSSVQIAFRRLNVLETGVVFDTRFGAGAKFPMGEELIFLSDLYRAGLRVSAVPIEIAHLEPSTSTWFTGYGRDYLEGRGASFARASKRWGWAYSMQWAIRKRALYRSEATLMEALAIMRSGARAWTQ